MKTDKSRQRVDPENPSLDEILEELSEDLEWEAQGPNSPKFCQKRDAHLENLRWEIECPGQRKHLKAALRNAPSFQNLPSDPEPYTALESSLGMEDHETTEYLLNHGAHFTSEAHYLAFVETWLHKTYPKHGQKTQTLKQLITCAPNKTCLPHLVPIATKTQQLALLKILSKHPRLKTNSALQIEIHCCLPSKEFPEKDLKNLCQNPDPAQQNLLDKYTKLCAKHNHPAALCLLLPLMDKKPTGELALNLLEASIPHSECRQKLLQWIGPNELQKLMKNHKSDKNKTPTLPTALLREIQTLLLSKKLESLHCAQTLSPTPYE